MKIDIISNIKERCPQKRVQQCCRNIEKKLSLSSVRDIGNVTELVHILYILGMKEEAINVSDILNDFEFTGNYTLWETVKGSRLMKVHILRELKRNKEADEIINKVMKYEHKEVWENQLRSLEVYDINIKDAVMRNSSRDILSWQLIKLEVLIRFYELPGFPIDKFKVQKELEDLLESIKTTIY